MVSFFGIKFGADKKKKEPEQAENSLYAQQWKASREEVLRQCSGMPGASSNRPSTAQGSLKGGAKSHTSIGSDGMWDTESRGSGAGFLGTSTSVTALPGPLTSHSLKPYASEANLKTNLGAMNGSSSSLAGPRLPFGGVSGGSDTGPRPGSAHSLRQVPGPGPVQGQGKPLLRPLDVNVMKETAPGVAVPPRSPLGQFELMSPVSDNESLLGEEPDKIAKEISNRIMREEEQTKSKAEVEERERVQAELRAQALRNVDASRPNTAKGYPSPPASIASIQGDRDAASALASGQQKPNAILKGPAALDLRPGSRGRDVPNVRPPPRSPLFQQSSPLELPRVNENDGDVNKLTVDYRPSHDRYGIPSPPLSNGQCSGEETEGRPVIRTVQAKRDTLIVGADRRGSLGLQIDEFEKTLQQAQAMTALEKGPEAMSNVVGGGSGGVGVVGGGGARSRGNSDGSSNYSDISESPMTIEPPLISPQPFPLTPRPMSPATRSSKPNLAEILAPTRRPTLEERSESPAGSISSSSRSTSTPVGSIRSNTADSMRPIRPRLEIRPESPANRPRLNGGAPPRRPTLEEYGIRINTVGSMDSRMGRPSPDGFDGRLNLAESPDRTDSPILKNVRNVFSPEQMSEAPSSADTSRSSSPIAAHHSVFSPPPPAKRPLPPPRSARAEWDLGPAPTAPPTTPLPIPEKNARRRAAERAQSPLPPTPKRIPTPTPPPGPVAGLASSASIVPDMLNNPNWPLPGPGVSGPRTSSSGGSSFEGSFSARRSLLPDRRAPPAPLNIAATKYADDVGCGGGGPDDDAADPESATLDVKDVGPGGGEAAVLRLTPIMQPQTAGGYKGEEEVPRMGRRDSLLGGLGLESGFVWREERTTVYKTAEEEDDDEDNEADDVVEQQWPRTATKMPAAVEVTPAYDMGVDKSCAIGVARGLSLKYDQMREQEKRARARDRMKAMRAWGAIEETATTTTTTGPISPPTNATTTWGIGGGGEQQKQQQSAERLRTAMHGLRSPTGIADEHGTGFI
ncbi:hypothetical protein VMCG_08795 [Cytospora schulzeri]|uniref:Uncharacterized protein n=1 Tax=Cytospora schulzeri TaxID=448051 RepID=A0A423VS95_9PEZI|nr:hypothetical protein VMCG_08795 [Valsa malicola]